MISNNTIDDSNNIMIDKKVLTALQKFLPYTLAPRPKTAYDTVDK